MSKKPTSFLRRVVLVWWRAQVAGLAVLGVILAIYFFQNMATDSQQGDAFVQAGLTNLEAERFGDAADQFQKALDSQATSDPRSNILLLLGHSLVKSGRFDEALSVLKETTELEPGNLPAFTLLGLAHAKLGQFAEAETAYNHVLDRMPTDVDTLINVGALAFRRTGSGKAAIPALRRATEADPHSMLAWFNLAVMAMEAGDCELAVSAGLKARDYGMANYDVLEGKLVENGCSPPPHENTAEPSE